MGRILLLGFLVTVAGAPESGAWGSARLRADSNLVLINATVVDGSDRFVTDLGKADFQLFEGGVLQQISTLSTEEVPVSAVIVFDASGSMKRSIAMAEHALRAFLDTANPADEFSVMTVRSHPDLSLPFVRDPEELLRCLTGIKGDGQTALLDAVYMAAGYVRKGSNARKAVLVISDGEDNHSRYTQSELLDALRETDVTLYSIGVNVRSVSYAPGEPPERTGANVLSEIAEATGGRYFEAWSPKELPGIMAKIDIRRQYVLGYSPVPLKPDGKYHRVELRLARQARQRHLRAFARPGYYAPLLQAAR